MSLASRLRVLLVCAALEMGVLGGVPMRPDEIRELMHQMNQPALAHVLPIEDEDGVDPPTECEP
jgi:hypothetical protein